MKIFLFGILLFPIVVFSQDVFAPVRIDTSSNDETLFYYPAVRLLPNGNLLAQWSSVSDSVGAFGREVTPAGMPENEIFVYDQEEYGELTCPPLLSNLYFNTGGLARYIFHS